MKDHEEQICRVHTCTYFKVCALQDLWDISLVFWGTISAVNQPLCMEHVFWWIKCLPVLSLIKKKQERKMVLFYISFIFLYINNTVDRYFKRKMDSHFVQTHVMLAMFTACDSTTTHFGRLCRHGVTLFWIQHWRHQCSGGSKWT